MLKVGDRTPDFEVKNENGRTIKWSSHKGRKWIIFFYPQDDTPSCTKEACSVKSSYHKLKSMGYYVLGVSPDSEKKHRNFIKKYKLPYRLGADTDRKMLNAFGVWGPKMFMGKEVIGVRRTSFVIDENGIISHVIDKVITKDHGQQILDLISGN